MAERAREDVEGLCDICHRRPAVVRVTVSQNGRRQALKVCRPDYARLQAQSASPFESLFGGGMFGDDLLGDFFGDANADQAPGQGRPRGRAADREAVDLAEYLSQQGEEILQQAARTAVEWGARDVDSEHLLHALADNDVVQAILARFKLSPQDLKRQVEELRPGREGRPRARDGEQVGVSPRVKAALEAAFRASRDLGHSYVGPEHLLIGLAEEEGLANDLLRRYGLTREALRQQAVHVVGKGAEKAGSRRRATRPTSTSTAATSRPWPSRGSSTR